MCFWEITSATVDEEAKLLLITGTGTGTFTITFGILSLVPHLGCL
ncbi:hypothetical protein [Clostridium folliculivorans]|nr:hypothetical protein [Clostridium folliculivorans]GKU29331.1 hypothetical protein CFB3_14370 [Clostridium folliculivorans]